jgi:hypothetical protein
VVGIEGGALRVYLIGIRSICNARPSVCLHRTNTGWAIAASAPGFRLVVINLCKEIHIRLNEFSTDYQSTEANTAKLLEQIERMWPSRIEDDDAPPQHRSKRHSQNDHLKSSDAL